MLLHGSLIALATLAAGAPVVVRFDERGVAEVRAGERLFLTSLGVALTAPGWEGTRGDQRSVVPTAVARQQEGEVSTLQLPLAAEGARSRLRQTIRPVAGGVRLEYELVPEADIAVENVLLGATLPVEEHAGKTRFVAAGESVLRGTCPAELRAEAYRFADVGVADWLALVAADGSAVRLGAEGLSLALQDNRRFDAPAFALQATTAHSRTLKAGEPVRFALTITATTPAAIDQDAARAAQAGLAGIPLTAREPLRAGTVTLDRATVPQFERVELTPDLAATFDNPFDPEDVAVDAEVTLPNRKRWVVPGFYYAPFRLETDGGRERLRLAGPACWKVRLTPTLPGTYRVVVKVRDRTGTAQCPPVTFRATPAKAKGFIRVSAASPTYFCHDDGSPYIAIGENLCWANGPMPLALYREWLQRLGAAGGNWARLWLAFNEKGLEWMPAPTEKPGTGTYLGLGRYALDNAWRLDEIVRLAGASGVRLMFCIGTFGELTTGGYFNEGSWVSNPYNAANGGPCREPEELWTNPTARKLYQRRLRYLVARWGYSPQVFAWEFWNEQNAPAAWVGEMAAYLKRHDVHRHLVSTTYGDDAVWKLPDIDFTMTHRYGDNGNVADFADDIAGDARAHRHYQKPYLLAEFGIDWRTSDLKYDPEGKGQNLHDGLWAGLLSGSAGTAMLWYWDNYVHPKNLYPLFTPVAKFAARVDWARTRFRPLEDIQVQRAAEAPERFTPLEIVPGTGWGKTPRNDYVVGRDGRIQGAPVAGTVGSPNRHTPAELHTRLTFHLDMPAEGECVITLQTVSGKAHLQIAVDDALQVDEPLDAGPEGEGPWKRSRYLEQWKVWQSDYERDYRVRVPAGKHRLTIANADGDWLSLRSIRLPAYRSSRYPDVAALGLHAGRTAVLWLHHRQCNWRTVLEGREPETLADLRVSLPGLPAGRYRVEWWDTYTGEVLRTDSATAARGALPLQPPPFARDVAAVVMPG